MVSDLSVEEIRTHCWFLVARLMEMHGESYSSVTVDEKGQRIERVDGYEPPVQSSV